MTFRFIGSPQDPFGGLFSPDGEPIYPDFFPAITNSTGSPSVAPVTLPAPAATPAPSATPTIPAEAVFAESVQNGAGGPGSVVAETSGSGITINLLFDAAAMAAPASFRAGIEQAAAILSATITNQITVNIKVDYSGTGGGASAGPDNGLYESYSAVRTDLINNAAPGDTTFNSLPTGSTIQGQSSVAVWNAQLKLFGLLSPNDTATDDGSATFATDINPNLLVGVALHELTHALGRVPFGSAPDIFDFFRFTSAGTRLFTDNIPAAAAYFSLDGGNTKLADFGLYSDPSDFLNPANSGLPAPYSNLTPNDAFNEIYTGSTIQALTAVDKEMLDALGFNTLAIVNGIVVVPNAGEALQGGPRHMLLSAAPAITDTAETTLASATIKIGNGGGTAVAGDQLYVNGVQNGTVGNGVTASWNASTDTLTLTGNATLAVYSTLLGEVSYADIGTDSSSGSHPSRTVTWSVNDGTSSHSTTSLVTIDRAPVATNDTAWDAVGQTITTTGVLSNDTDLDGDTLSITGVSDATHGAGSIGTSLAGVYGHLTLNANGSYSYVADNLSAISAQPAGSHPLDVFTYTESDGNGGIATGTLGITMVQPPVVTASTVTASTPGEVFAASSLFSATDPGGYPITEYYFYDKTSGNGYWALNGVAQPSNQDLAVTAAQLSEVTFHSGTSGSDNLLVCADDPYSEAPWTAFSVNAAAVHPPVVTASNVTASTPGEVFAASSLFSATDPGGYPITEYYFYDKTSGNGYWALNGVAQPSNQDLAVTAAQLSEVTFHSGTSGSDNLLVCADDPYSEAPWTAFSVNAAAVHPPVVTASNVTASTPGEVFAASSLFSAIDPGGYPITEYYFYDKTSGNGYWALNGVAQPSNQDLAVTAAQLSEVTFHSGTSGSDNLLVCADDPYSEAPWTAFSVNAAVVHPPVVTASNVTASTPGEVFAASSLFSATDPGGYPITEYYFYDKTSGNGYWALNGVAQPSNQDLAVTAAQLSEVTFHSGTSGSDNLLVCADDPYSEAPWTAFSVNAAAVHPPVVTASNVTASTPGEVFAASSLFSATDPGGYPITEYYFYDKTSGNGYWALNGVAQPSNQDLAVTAAQLSEVTFHSGTSGSDNLLVCADDPYSEAPWTAFSVNAPVSNSTPANALEAAGGATLQIDDGTTDNTSNILVVGTLAVDVPVITLTGTGTVTLTGGTIVGTANGETLHNDGNTISGIGTIGDGSGFLALDNASGIIDANGGALVLDSGTTITNAGTLEAAPGATLWIDDPVTGSGGTATIGAGATIELAAADSENVTFNDTTGKLILDHASTFGGEIFGFTGDGTLAGSDQIDLRGLHASSIQSAYNSSTGVLEVSDGTTTVDLKFAGTYSLANFKFADDGSGGTIVYDPPVSSHLVPSEVTAHLPASQVADRMVNASAAAGHDSFVFASNLGQNPIAQVTHATDTIENSQSIFQSVNAHLAASHDDIYGHAFITDPAHDILTVQHVTAAQLLAHQGDFHL